MKFFTKFLFTLLLLFAVKSLQAQCTTDGGSGNGLYPSAAAALVSTCIPVTVTTAAYTGEYSRLSGAAAQTYSFTSSVATDFLTITDAATNTAIAWGVTPLTYTFASAPGDLFLYRNDNSSCAYLGGQSSRTISVQCTSCASAGVPACTTNSAPANAATGVSITPTISWAASTNAALYNIYFGTSVASATLLGGINATSATLTAVANLQPLTTYYWYVVPVGCDGVAASGCSANATSFTTGAPPPVNDNPTGAIALSVGATCSVTNATNAQATTTTANGYANPVGCSIAASPTDVWFTVVAPSSGSIKATLSNAVGAAGQMALFSATSSAGPFTVITSSCNSAATAGTFATPLLGSGLTGGATYYIRVAGYGSANPTGTFDICVVELLAPTCITSPLTPSNAATGVSVTPTLSWTANPDATSYDIYWGTSPNPTGAGASATPINQVGTTYTIPASTLTNNTTYYWKAVPKNAVGAAVGCTDWTFTTVPAPTVFSGTGNWSDPTKWSNGLPSCGADATIGASAVCNVDINTAQSLNLVINGTLNFTAASGVKVGSCSDTQGGSKLVTLAATAVVTMSGGTLEINGRLLMTSLCKFTQTGGTLKIDPNDGTVGNSVASGTHILTLAQSGTTAAPNIKLDGGTILLVDPPFGTTGNSVMTGTVAGVGIIPSGGHTFQFGDGVSTTPGGYPFEIATLGSTARLGFWNILVDCGNALNRRLSSVNTAANMTVLNNLTINPNSEFRAGPLNINKDFVNNGIFASASTLGLQSYNLNTSSTAIASTNPITISGSGIFRNNATPASVTANIVNLTINNTNAAGATFAMNFQVSGTLTHTAGIINMGTNTLTIGINATTIGTWAWTAGRVVGKVKKWFSTAIGTGAWTFPVGTLAVNRNAALTFSATPITTGGTLTVEFKSATPNTTGLPATINAQTIDKVSPTGHWQIDAGDGLDFTGKTYTASFDATGFTKVNGTSAITDLTGLRLIKRSSTATDWADVSATAGTAAPTNLNAVSIAGQSTFSIFAVGGTAAVLPITLQSFTAFERGNVNVINWETDIEQNVRNYVIEKSSNGLSWAALGTVKPNTSKRYGLTDNTPFITTYYRLKNEDTDDRSNYSTMVVVERQTGKFNITSVAPNPTSNDLTVKFETIDNVEVAINVLDIFGKVVLTQQVDAVKGINSTVVNTSNLPAGAYFLNVNNGVNTLTQRIVKQ